MSEAILLSHDGRHALATADAEALKTAALEKSALVGAVRNPAENTAATEAMKDIRRVLKAIESARKAVKAPVLDLAAAIDRAASEFAQELKDEELRLSKMAADYQSAEMERVRAIERKRQEEQARIERERQEAEAKARAEAEARMQAAKDEAERKRIAAEAERAVKAADERAKQEAMALPVAAPVKAAGQSVRDVWEFEVTDIWLLARTMPALVRIEPNRAEINEVIERLAANGEPKIPGLRITKATKVSVRTGREPKTIEV